MLQKDNINSFGEKGNSIFINKQEREKVGLGLEKDHELASDPLNHHPLQLENERSKDSNCQAPAIFNFYLGLMKKTFFERRIN